jgi:predicted N-acyltransferase
MDRFYRRTVKTHWGGRAYMRPGFFESLVELCPEEVEFVCAYRGPDLIAGALYLQSANALYGRYWGADEYVKFLHFDLAYYCGIERAIDHRLPLFEAGAQGEHKLLRGFVPARTYSRHWFRHRGLSRAIEGFLEREALEVQFRIKQLSSVLPFKDI